MKLALTMGRRREEEGRKENDKNEKMWYSIRVGRGQGSMGFMMPLYLELVDVKNKLLFPLSLDIPILTSRISNNFSFLNMFNIFK